MSSTETPTALDVFKRPFCEGARIVYVTRAGSTTYYNRGIVEKITYVPNPYAAVHGDPVAQLRVRVHEESSHGRPRKRCRWATISTKHVIRITCGDGKRQAHDRDRSTTCGPPWPSRSSGV